MDFITNTKGERSASLTLAIIAFVLVSLWLLLGGILNISHVRQFDVGSAVGFLSPCLALYFGRRHTDATTATPPATAP